MSTKSELEIEDKEDVEGEVDEESPSRSASAGDLSRYAWYDSHVPPFAIWVAGSDDLVDGQRLLRRFRHGREPHVRVVHEKVIPGYEHLDVIWAVDVIDQLGREALQCIWKTIPGQYRGKVRVPWECERVDFLDEKGG